MRPLPLLALSALSLLLPSALLRAQEDPSVFGTLAPSPNSLIGILYDLKQTQAREKLHVSTTMYNDIVDEFLSRDWDESVLNRYYRVTRPLYTTQIFVPLMAASGAPTAFQVQDIVAPSYWIIHYKGQVTPPTSGTWRFWGYGEEVCSVAINGKNVLLSNWKEITAPKTNWDGPTDIGQPIARGHLKAGNWFELKKDEMVDLDVIIGERAGGVFCSFLLIEQKGANYEMYQGKPVLPVFQLKPAPVSQPEYPAKGPRIAQDGPIWKGVP